MQPHAKRRRKLVNARLQLRLTAVFAGISVLSCLLLTLGIVSILLEAANDMPSGGQYVADMMPSLFQKAVFFSMVIVLPATVVIGVLTTFRVAGPVYRFEQYLATVAAGEADGPCRIRKGDYLVELCEAINKATEPLLANGDEECEDEVQAHPSVERTAA